MTTFEGKALIFDLDGTLVDTADDLAASMNYALRERGIKPVDPKEVRHLVGFGARRMLTRGIELSENRIADEVELDEALAAFLSHYEVNIADHSVPFDGALAMIDRFRALGMKIAICTNKREFLAKRLIAALGICDRFEVIVGGDSAGVAKPDPAPVQMCLEAVGASTAVFLGDSDTDIRAAANAGLPCLIAGFGYGPVTLSDQIAATFQSYGEAERQILNLFRQSACL